jgi:hypothetical protein
MFLPTLSTRHARDADVGRGRVRRGGAVLCAGGALLVLCGSDGVANATESIRLVPQYHQRHGAGTAVLDALFDGRLTSGKPIDVQLPMPGMFDAQGILEIWPESVPGCKESPGERRKLTQYHRLGMTLDGTGADRALRAHVPPLQIGIHYCFSVEILRDYAEAELADAGARVADKLWTASSADLLRDQAPALIAAALASVTGQVPSEATRERAAQTLSADLLGSVEWQALQAKQNGFIEQGKTQARAQAQLELARCAFPGARACDRPAPVAALPDASPLILTLNGAVRGYARLAGLAATADLDAIANDLARRYMPDVRVATAIRLVDAARGTAATSPAHQLAVAGLRALIVEPSLFDPVTKGWTAAARFDPQRLTPDDVDELIGEVSTLGGVAPGPEVARWSAALTELKRAIEAVTHGSQAVSSEAAGLDTARANFRAAIAKAMTSPAMHVAVHLGVSFATATSARAVAADDNAAPVAPQVGLMLAAPLIDGETPWVAPYVAIDIYLQRVDRVIDLEDLVGPTQLQKWSFSVGLLAVRPTLNDRAITGLWTEQVPIASIGRRVTQFVRVDAGGFLFHFRSNNPEVNRPRNAGAIFVGASIDVDVWAAAAGKVFK